MRSEDGISLINGMIKQQEMQSVVVPSAGSSPISPELVVHPSGWRVGDSCVVVAYPSGVIYVNSYYIRMVVLSVMGAVLAFECTCRVACVRA